MSESRPDLGRPGGPRRPDDEWPPSPLRWLPIGLFVLFFLYVIWNSCCFSTVSL